MTEVWCELALVDERPQRGVLIEIEDGRFATVTVGAAPGGARTLAGFTIPGLANVHSHAFHRALRSRTQADRGTFWTWRLLMYRAAARLDPDSYSRLARAVFAEMTLAGISCVGEFHYLHHRPDGTPYRVFTPYFRRGCLSAPPPRQPLPVPSPLVLAATDYQAAGIDGLRLLPETGWDEMLAPHWQIGEAGATARLAAFINQDLLGYKDGRNFPARPSVSRLSPHLHWGEVSPNTVWYATKDRIDAGTANHEDGDHFLSELGWREFSHALLYYFPDLPRQNLQPRFDAFAWKDDVDALRCWQHGQTGYPIVDAAMRQLWQTGYMHNRLRMIVGSFLVKNLRLHWHHGEAWFWDCLVDADLANNSASWQWIAGCGADAAPYFRIFNPITQASKFDPNGDFIRHFVPELAGLTNDYLFSPWEAPRHVLDAANVVLGQTYPHPFVDVKASRLDALAAFAALKDTA